MTQQATKTNSEYLETPPSAGRMAVAVAGYPYSPSAAILDITDNAVEAAADRIAILLNQWGKSLKSIAIADNGTGIPAKILDEVLRAGSKTNHLYGKESLSRYGIGLKGAGFSLGNRISVITSVKGHPLARRAIDLKYIQENDSWAQEIREPNKDEIGVFQAAMAQLPEGGQRESGTVILVEDLNIRSRDLARLKTAVVRQLGETYGKFLSGRDSAGLQIAVVDMLNMKQSERAPATVIEAVDPLHRENTSTLVLYSREEIKLEDGTSIFFSAAALPHPNAISQDLRRKYRYTQANQGIYVYRNGRLLLSGDTLDLFAKDFHFNAFRAELEYTSAADEHVLVDVAKSHVTLSPEVFSRLQELTNVAVKTAETLWREKDVLTQEDIKGVFDESNSLIASRHRLIVDLAKKRREKQAKAESSEPDKIASSQVKPTSKVREDIPYVRPQEFLPEDVLYRPIFDPAVQAVVVDINLAHPFSKAVFSVSPGEGKRAVPRKATTAVQQLMYVLGHVEHMLNDEPENRELFEQFRRYASMNLRALLAD
jgi:Histidine kinase-, DNA gyrase B-, and HSP90-like ATPase